MYPLKAGSQATKNWCNNHSDRPSDTRRRRTHECDSTRCHFSSKLKRVEACTKRRIRLDQNRCNIERIESGNPPSGEPSSNPISQNFSCSHRRIPTTQKHTIAVLANSMRRSISDQDNHLARCRSPIQVQRLSQCGSDRLRAISTATGEQRLEVLVHLLDVGRKSKVFGDVGVVLGRVVSEGYQADAEVFWEV